MGKKIFLILLGLVLLIWAEEDNKGIPINISPEKRKELIEKIQLEKEKVLTELIEDIINRLNGIEAEIKVLRGKVERIETINTILFSLPLINTSYTTQRNIFDDDREEEIKKKIKEEIENRNFLYLQNKSSWDWWERETQKNELNMKLWEMENKLNELERKLKIRNEPKGLDWRWLDWGY